MQLGDIETEWERSGRGLRQGRTLSQARFSLYREELAVRMRRINARVGVGKRKVCLLLYAGDVVVMSESGEELQDLLKMVNEYGKDCVI